MLGRFPPADHLVDGVVDEGLQTVTPDGDLACGILIILEMAKLVGGSWPEFEGLCTCLKILLLLVWQEQFKVIIDDLNHPLLEFFPGLLLAEEHECGIKCGAPRASDQDKHFEFMVNNIWEGADAQTHLLVETPHWINWDLIRSRVILIDDAPLVFGDHLVILSCNEVVSEVRIIRRAWVPTG